MVGVQLWEEQDQYINHLELRLKEATARGTEDKARVETSRYLIKFDFIIYMLYMCNVYLKHAMNWVQIPEFFDSELPQIYFIHAKNS